MLSKLVTFLEFRFSQRSVAKKLQGGGNLCNVFIENYESTVERILKIGPHLPKLLSNVKGLTFWDTVYKNILKI